MRRATPILLLLALVGPSFAALSGPAIAGPTHALSVTRTGRGAGSVTTDSYRPDAWIKLCGLSTGLHDRSAPPPVARQRRLQHDREEAEDLGPDGGREGVRYWILLENDGAEADTIVVQGCQGNRRFVVNKVLLGKHKRPEAGTTDVTGRFKNGTLTFDFPPTSERKRSVFTLNMIAPTTAEGVSYTCRITIHSQNAPTVTDTVVAKMTTY